MKSERFEFYAGETDQTISLTIGGSETITDATFEFVIKRRFEDSTALITIADGEFDESSLASLRKLFMDLDIPSTASGEYLGFLTITMASGQINIRPIPPRQIVFNIIGG